ncbi:isoaspartyl peptidase/L-asparaginase family protein [Sphingobacterium sp. BS-2]|uniref:isoaspartyl peptidase/L-asparaginase family protein n=1 Tax=Sphingobacterium sp. BS-2 TaxID=3377129 RepID=UPI0038FC3E35
MARKRIALALHGGAGPLSKYIIENEEAYREHLLQYAERGYELLGEGCTAVDVVRTVISLLEDDPLFNAGRGSALNFQGRVEMDACLMDGRTGDSGAVCSITEARNPILVASLVMERTGHMLISGSGADDLARQFGAVVEAPDFFLVRERLREWQEFRASQVDPWSVPNRGTVGAVALDAHGDLASGTSTGGITGRLKGRVGDSCIIGAGCYAQNGACAVSGTGDGEFLMREFTALSIFQAYCKDQGNVQQHCQTAVHRHRARQADMGVICIDQGGEIGISYNSERMFRAWADGRGITAGIY